MEVFAEDMPRSSGIRQKLRFMYHSRVKRGITKREGRRW